MTIHDTKEALVEALVLAIEAPTPEQADRATQLAEEFAASLSERDVADAKRSAKVRVRLRAARSN